MTIRKLGQLLFICAALALGSEPISANTENAAAEGPHIRVTLVAERPSATPGSTLAIGILFEPEPGWHTYWLNPGDSGEPPKVTLGLPQGVRAGPWQWQTPQVIPVAHLINYGYDRSLLMTELSVSEAQVEPLTIDANLTWLVCKEDCIPGDASLSLTLPVVARPSDSAKPSALFQSAREHHYARKPIDARFQVSEQTLSLRLPAHINTDWQLLPFGNDWIDHSRAPAVVTAADHTSVSFTKNAAFWQLPDTLEWLAIAPDGSAFSFVATALATAAEPSPHYHFALYLLFAFAGGLILNVMPCVLPVLAIKAFSLSQPNQDQVRTGNSFLLGVVASFLVFALALELAKALGENLGWGFQMQSAGFVAFLALLFFVLGLWLLDALQLGQRAQQWAGGIETQRGPVGSFFTGCLAVLVATPCTAPFMATALGFGLGAGAAENLAIFLALALGFAAPLWLLHWQPSLRRWLPAPGPWMLHFKHLLAFPLFATAIWLVWVLSSLAGTDGVIKVLVAAMLAGLGGYLTLLSHARLRVAGLLLLALSLATGVYLNSGEHPTDTSASHTVKRGLTELSEAREQASATGGAVLVNVTADWCITCKVNEQVAFNDAAVQARLSQSDITYVEIDWTRKDPEILAFLQSFGRSGVPLYVFYPATGQPVVLPQLLSPALVLSYLQGETP